MPKTPGQRLLELEQEVILLKKQKALLEITSRTVRQESYFI
jgi:hypothetical protein